MIGNDTRDGDPEYATMTIAGECYRFGNVGMLRAAGGHESAGQTSLTLAEMNGMVAVMNDRADSVLMLDHEPGQIIGYVKKASVTPDNRIDLECIIYSPSRITHATHGRLRAGLASGEYDAFSIGYDVREDGRKVYVETSVVERGAFATARLDRSKCRFSYERQNSKLHVRFTNNHPVDDEKTRMVRRINVNHQTIANAQTDIKKMRATIKQYEQTDTQEEHNRVTGIIPLITETHDPLMSYIDYINTDQTKNQTVDGKKWMSAYTNCAREPYMDGLVRLLHFVSVRDTHTKNTNPIGRHKARNRTRKRTERIYPYKRN